MKNDRVQYYSDPVNDDFAGTSINTCEVGADFPYVRSSVLWKGLSFLVYYIIAVPIVFLVSKLYLGLRFENRKAPRSLRGAGYYLYGNHTRVLDAFVPAMAAYPKKAYIIAGPDAVSISGLKHIVMMLGALPIPTELSAMRAFLEAVSQRYKENNCVAIYPEAHIWPFYTGIRPFSDTAFRYPVKENAPVIAMVTTYRKRKGLFQLLKKPGMTVIFSDPMFPDPSLSPRKAQRELRDRVYRFMEETAEGREQVEYIRYCYALADQNAAESNDERNDTR
ncbi:MAG: 1-acyl-sn-glycerol-3-phosphate acyltransferase [Oscillospiraceae bacterium]|nr:1-acyl-sn-glycerol-3-phosphate acyltransferase [Oscillospiraceae bacterium]